MSRAEAVEAAARAMAQFEDWGHVSDEKKAHLRRSAKRALEAAAPHLKAEAWESAYALGYADRNVGAEPTRTNPYRSKP